MTVPLSQGQKVRLLRRESITIGGKICYLQKGEIGKIVSPDENDGKRVWVQFVTYQETAPIYSKYLENVV